LAVAPRRRYFLLQYRRPVLESNCSVKKNQTVWPRRRRRRRIVSATEVSNRTGIRRRKFLSAREEAISRIGL
jgi:hypothetical protein